MKKKTKLLTILLFTLMIAGSGYSKIANAACWYTYDSGGAASAICW